MTYQAGFSPDAVFTAPLKSGSVIVPRGVPGGTFSSVSCSSGISNLPDFRNCTGPTNSGSVSESGGGNWEMSTLVPIVAIGGMTLHPGPGEFVAGPGPLPARSRCSSSADAVPANAVTVRAADSAKTPQNRRKGCELGSAGKGRPYF